MKATRKGDVVHFNHAADRHKLDHYERDPDDFYVEEVGCTEALLDREKFYGNIFDPCCGQGNVATVARQRGHQVYASDLKPRWSQQDWLLDFMQPLKLPAIDNIASNPPFRKGLIVPIIRKMLSIAKHKVAVLVPAPFLYSIERYHLFQEHRPKRILHFSSRPSMPPGKMLAEGAIKAKGGKEDYSWIIFSTDHEGGTLTDWILLPEAAAKQCRKAERNAAAHLRKG